MPHRPTLAGPDSEPTESTEAARPSPDQLLADLLPGPVDPRTRYLVTAAAGDDPVLLRALLRTAVGLLDLVRHDGTWTWGEPLSRTGHLASLIETRAGELTGAQLAALRKLLRTWAEPYAAVQRITAERAARDRSSTPDGTEGPAALTRRECEVLALLGSGLTARAIGRRLFLSPRTVAKYQERIYRKLGTSDRLTTVLHAQRVGLLPAGDTPADE